jgi:hypothetical protein
MNKQMMLMKWYDDGIDLGVDGIYYDGNVHDFNLE